MNTATPNVDYAEVQKFEDLAHRWWDRDGEFKPLHDLNPLRLDYIERYTFLAGKKVVDVGCGGGILSESLAQSGAEVTGIDMGEAPLSVAKLHQLESNVQIEYRQIAVEDLAEEQPQQYDVVTCMEMLEHVPDPASVIAACAKLVKPDGHLFFSTLNRTTKAWLFAIVGAEYVLRMLPRGTHDHNKFIKPAEMERYLRGAGLKLDDLTGMSFNPLTTSYSLGRDVDVNYLAHAQPHPSST